MSVRRHVKSWLKQGGAPGKAEAGAHQAAGSAQEPPQEALQPMVVNKRSAAADASQPARATQWRWRLLSIAVLPGANTRFLDASAEAHMVQMSCSTGRPACAQMGRGCDVAGFSSRALLAPEQVSALQAAIEERMWAAADGAVLRGMTDSGPASTTPIVKPEPSANDGEPSANGNSPGPPTCIL